MKVLLPVDGSDSSIMAAEYVIDLMHANPSIDVTVLSVACKYEASHFADSWVGEDDLNLKCRQMYDEKLTQVKKYFDDANLPVRTVLLAGEPDDVITSYVEDHGIDQVIMGNRGLSSLKGMLLGSVAISVLGKVKVPVAIVKGKSNGS